MANSKSTLSIPLDVDRVMNELGQFKRYHLSNYVMMAILVYVASFYGTNYIFLAADVPYRCLFPECEQSNSTEYKVSWLPPKLIVNGHEDRCTQRQISQLPPGGSCDDAVFSEERKSCDQWVYSSNDTIITEFNLACQDWKRTLVGTIHNIGMFFSLPIMGYISDRWGRKRALILSSTLVGVIGTLKAFSFSYVMFVVIDFLDTVAGASAFPIAYVITIELLGQNKRVLTTVFLGIVLVLGELSMAAIAKNFPYWRTLILIIYPPSILFITYSYFLPESIRWLVSKGRKEEAAKIILNAAKMNNVTLSEDMMRQLTEKEKIEITVNQKEKQEEESGVWSQVMQSRIIMSRLAICSWWWITCTFVFYGLAINSVSLAGDKYTNFMLVAGVEVIAVAGNALLLDRIGRKVTLLIAYYVCGLSLVAMTFVPSDLAWLSTLLYLVGKVGITQAFSGIYMYTSELFPTHARQSLLGFCSMVGRVGSIVAPQMPLLALYVKWLPSVLFGGTALLAGTLMMTTPETLHVKLPDTFEEAEALSKQPKMYVADITKNDISLS